MNPLVTESSLYYTHKHAHTHPPCTHTHTYLLAYTHTHSLLTNEHPPLPHIPSSHTGSEEAVNAASPLTHATSGDIPEDRPRGEQIAPTSKTNFLKSLDSQPNNLYDRITIFSYFLL